MDGKLPVAVIGYGHLGKWHCQKVEQIPEVSLVAIVETSPQQRLLAQSQHPQCQVVEDLWEVMDQFTAALIVTPTSTHFDLLKVLIGQQKHLLCEKPLVSTLVQAQEIARLTTPNFILQVGHSERCHQVWNILHSDFLDFLRPPYTVKINRYAPFKGRATDVDVVSDLMIHDLDLLAFVLGQKVSKIQAYGHKSRTNEYDHVTAVCQLHNQCAAILTAGRNHVEEVRTFEIVNQHGTLLVDLLAQRISWTLPSSVNQHYVQQQSYLRQDHLLMEQQYFYQSILHQRPVFVGVDDGVVSIAQVEAVLHALQPINNAASVAIGQHE